MIETDYDLLVIGGGSGGHAAAVTAAGLGLKTAVIERAEQLGSLCILRGCMPSKTLIETANRMREIRAAAEFGIKVGPPELDREALLARLHRLIGGFQDHRVGQMRSGRYELLRGDARFRSPHEVEIQDRDGRRSTLSARTFVIATGSESFMPDIPGLAGTPCWTSDDVVKLPPIPRHLVVIGSGGIGMECAHLFEGFGAKVTILSRSSRILSQFDPDVSAATAAASRERGITILEETEAARVSHANGRFTLELTGPGDPAPLEADALLVATGRLPSLDGLELDRAGVAVASGSIVIDKHAATSVPHIFAAGDCTNVVPVVHLAVIHGEVGARNAARLIRRDSVDPQTEWHEHQQMLALFTSPEVVRLGLTLDEARDKGIDAHEVRYDYLDHGKGAIVGDRHGFVKIVAERSSGRILGAGGAGPAIIDSAHAMQVALDREMTVRQLLNTPFYHPTLAEIWSYAAEKMLAKPD